MRVVALLAVLAVACASSQGKYTLVAVGPDAVFDASSSDIGGRVVVNGDSTVSYYQLGERGTPETVNTLTVAGGVSVLSSEVYGSVVYCTSKSFTSSTVTGVVRKDCDVDYSLLRDQILGYAKTLAEYPATGGVSRWDNQTTIYTDPALPVNVYRVPYYLFNSISLLTIEGSNGTDVVVIVEDAPARAQFSGFQTNLVHGITADTITYLFPGATTLDVLDVGVKGTLLVPEATVHTKSAVITGSVYCHSYVGSGQVNPIHPVTPPCPTVPCPTCPSTGLPPLPSFGLYASGSCKMRHSDNTGSAACGGGVTMGPYAQGQGLTGHCPLALISGGDIDFLSGGVVVYGSVAAAGTVNCADATILCSCSAHDSAVNFDKLNQAVMTFFDYVTALAATDSIFREYGMITFKVSSSGPVAVFDVPAKFLNGCTGITIIAPSNVQVIIRFIGDDLSLGVQNFQFNLQGGVTESGVLLVFPTATSLTITEVNVRGSVLAPFAALSFSAGHATGSLYVQSADITGQIDPVPPFTPICPACPVIPCKKQF